MDLHISDSVSIKAIQNSFNSEFPFLKIEFFKRKQIHGEGLPKHVMYTGEKLIGDVRTIHTEGDIHIIPEMKVNEMENLFGFHYGLSIQVFRKSGNVWLETTATDGWSLKQQNEEGKSLSLHMKQESRGFDDFREQE